MPDSRTFELGLVMAGAISAGAYTGGVIDFLIEALESWEQAKTAANDGTGPAVPQHSVQIKVMAGTSAGGMTTAIAGAALGGDIVPVRELGQRKPNNRFYNCWVEDIDMEHLLATNDLDGGKPVVSALDSTVLEKIVAKAIDITPSENRRRPYIADPLRTILTATNLRGVPYNIKLAGVGGTAGSNHGMRLHADFLQFDISMSDPGTPGVRWLNPLDYHEIGREAWQSFGTAALATGAFPVGLAPRVLEQSFEAYQTRTWSVSLDNDEARASGKCQVERQVRSELNDTGTFDFVAVDGGVMNNEPLELARRFLGEGKRNSRQGDKAKRAVLMIDPFPSQAIYEDDHQPDNRLLKVIPALFSSLIAQARFKMDELLLAQEDSVYSRFLISPTRSFGTEPEKFAIACGSLGGFGGFLARTFRDHDYQLGRRNCQRFLQQHFVLPENNEIVRGPEWDAPEMTAQFGVNKPSGLHRPIIPVVGSAAAEISLSAADWPSLDKTDTDVLEKQIRRRANAVVPGLISDISDSWMVRLAARAAWSLMRGRLVKQIRKRIEKELKDRGQFV